MKSRYFIIFFILLWIFCGLILFYYQIIRSMTKEWEINPNIFITSLKPPHIPSNLASILHLNRSNAMSASYMPLNSMNAPVLSNYQSMEVILPATKRLILFDWPFDSDRLSYLNYKSFESYLVNCYGVDIKIEVMILAYDTANYYKVEHLLSKQTFAKYEKKGYDISTVVYPNATSLFTGKNYRKESEISMVYGKDYYDNYMKSCCNTQISLKKNNVKEMSIAFWFYGRFARLYEQGGEYFDLAWFHQKKLTKAMQNYYSQAFYIANFCYNTTTLTILPPPDSIKAQYYIDPNSNIHDFKCTSSTAMYFQPKNIMLKCVLEEYDQISSKLHQCLRRAQHWRLEVIPYFEAFCVENLMNQCLDTTKLLNGMKSLVAVSSPLSEEREFLENDGCGRLQDTTDDPLKKQLHFIPMLWLGPKAVSGYWHTPIKGSHFDNNIFHINRVMKRVVKDRKESINKIAITSGTKCRPYKLSNRDSSWKRRQGYLSCTLSFVVPGFMKAGTTYLFDILTKHPQILSPLRGYGFKETGCYHADHDNHPTAQRMNCFPFVESLDNMIYGDGTVHYIHNYHSAKFLSIENPNLKVIIILRDPVERVKSHHRFSYSQLVERNIGDLNKIIDIALASGSRLDYLSKLLAPAIQDANRNNWRRSKAIENFVNYASTIWTADIDKLAFANSTFQRAGNVLLTSVYFPHIYLWDQIFGVNNIYVMEGERITYWRSAKKLEQKQKQKQNQSSTINSFPTEIESVILYTGFTMKMTQEEEISNIFRFLGLNPLEKIPTIYQHRTSSNIIKQHKLSPESKEKLELFYQPFNHMLSLYLNFRNKYRNK